MKANEKNKQTEHYLPMFCVCFYIWRQCFALITLSDAYLKSFHNIVNGIYFTVRQLIANNVMFLENTSIMSESWKTQVSLFDVFEKVEFLIKWENIYLLFYWYFSFCIYLRTGLRKAKI